MKAIKPMPASSPTIFDPADPGDDMSWVGKRQRKRVPLSQQVPRLTLKWPEGAKQRYDLFDAWHDVAMQIVHDVKGDFRLLAVLKKVMQWSTGTIALTNMELASRGGYCAEKTISRAVTVLDDLGLLVVKHGARKIRGKIIRTRVLRLALPEELGARIRLPSVNFDLDTRGPAHNAFDLDTRGPGSMDTRGPDLTTDTIGEGDDAA